MALDQIRLGTPPSAQDGDDARTAFTRANNNFKSIDDMGFTGATAGTRNVTDYNNAITPGRFAALSGGEANRPPNIQYGLIDNIQHNAAYLVQTVVDVLSGRQATRGYNPTGAGTWSAWRQVVNADEIGTAAAATLTTSTLDTTAGRVLRVNDFGVGGVLSVFTANANNLSYNVCVWTAPGATGLPSSNYGYLTHSQSNDSGYATQSWQQLNHASVFRRVKQGGAWGPWIRANANDLAVGVVSLDVNQSSLFETGSSGAGRYVRFMDGTQICYSWGTQSAQVAAGANVTVSWTFPVPFVDAGYAVDVNVEPTGYWDHYGAIGYTGKVNTGVSAVIRNGASGAQTFIYSLMAVGRWK